MELDNAKLMECVEWKRITEDEVILNIDGEKLRETLYDEVHVKMEGNNGRYKLYSNGKRFCTIRAGGILSEKDCQELAIEIKTKINNRIRSELDL